ncbi:MAG: hypothetical protein CMH62_01960 [Nanoarchaeota archaeon]|nr:hypothetical protein [Nanoarchaeota archaeon]|tara:strand:+ start:1715 stop:2017 length:303 start_codon:yes stop_codon:yes gene_type:complete
MNEVTDDKLKKYFAIAERAFTKAKESKESVKLDVLKNARGDFLDTVERYIEDAKHFSEEGDKVNAFAALNYAHGWLDAGVKLGIFDVNDNKLFAGVELEK